MPILESCIHGLLAISSLITFSHFLVPNRVLDIADNLVLKSWNWLDDHNFKRMCEAAYQGKLNRVFIGLGLSYVFIDTALRLYAYATDGHLTFIEFSLVQNGLVIIFILGYRITLAPIVGWIFKNRKSVILKLLLLHVGFMTAALVIAFTAVMLLDTKTILLISDAIEAVNNGAQSVAIPLYNSILAFFAILLIPFCYIAALSILCIMLFCYVFLWGAIQTAAYILRRSIERKGLAAFLAASSGLATIVLKFFPS